MQQFIFILRHLNGGHGEKIPKDSNIEQGKLGREDSSEDDAVFVRANSIEIVHKKKTITLKVS